MSFEGGALLLLFRLVAGCLSGAEMLAGSTLLTADVAVLQAAGETFPFRLLIYVFLVGMSHEEKFIQIRTFRDMDLAMAA